MSRRPPRSTRPATLLPVSTLFRSGARTDVVSRATVDEFLHVVPHAQHVEFPQATHMVAGDANDAFTQEVERFVQSMDSLSADRRSAGAVQPRPEEHTSELQSLMRI